MNRVVISGARVAGVGAIEVRIFGSRTSPGRRTGCGRRAGAGRIVATAKRGRRLRASVRSTKISVTAAAANHLTNIVRPPAPAAAVYGAASFHCAAVYCAGDPPDVAAIPPVDSPRGGRSIRNCKLAWSKRGRPREQGGGAAKPPALTHAANDDRRVVPAETEAVRHGRFQSPFAWPIGRIVEIALGIGIVQIDRWRNHAVA